MKDTEKCNKVKLGKLEGELLVQKQANAQLTKDLDEKNQLSSQLKASKTYYYKLFNKQLFVSKD